MFDMIIAFEMLNYACVPDVLIINQSSGGYHSAPNVTFKIRANFKGAPRGHLSKSGPIKGAENTSDWPNMHKSQPIKTDYQSRR